MKTAPRTSALAAFRQVAQDRGALWLRAVLDKRGVACIAPLSLAELHAIVADPDEAAKRTAA